MPAAGDGDGDGDAGDGGRGDGDGDGALTEGAGDPATVKAGGETSNGVCGVYRPAARVALTPGCQTGYTDVTWTVPAVINWCLDCKITRKVPTLPAAEVRAGVCCSAAAAAVGSRSKVPSKTSVSVDVFLLNFTLLAPPIPPPPSSSSQVGKEKGSLRTSFQPPPPRVACYSRVSEWLHGPHWLTSMDVRVVHSRVSDWLRGPPYWLSQPCVDCKKEIT
jgi:hypothetical protein